MPSGLYRLQTLGTVVLEGPGMSIRAADHRQQRRRLALLAALASSGDRGMSRDQLLLLFWPDSTQKKARHSLDQLLYAIRQSLGESVFQGTNPIRLDGSIIGSDVIDFKRHIADGRLNEALAMYRGQFLEGFYLSDTREFEEWAESERRQLSSSYESALEKLAAESEKAGELGRAIEFRKKLAAADPLSTRHAIALMQVLARSGDLAAAISYGERYERDAVDAIGAQGIGKIRKLVSELKNVLLNSSDGIAVVIPANRPHAPPSVRRLRAMPYIALAVIAVIALGASLMRHNNSSAQPARERRGTSNVAAYDLYLRGSDRVMMRNDSTALLALSYLEQATQLDPSFAAAHAGLAMMYARRAMSNSPAIARDELRKRALSEAEKAVALDDSLAEAHMTLGMINSYWLIDLNKGRAELLRAIELDPHEAHAREYLALTSIMLGQPAEAVKFAQQSVDDDPLSPTNRATLALSQYVIGRCDLALPTLDSLATMKPPLLRVAGYKSLCLGTKGRWDEAAEVMRSAPGANGSHMMGFLAIALAKGGHRDEAVRIRAKLEQDAASNAGVHFDLALIDYALGDIDDAFAELRRSVDAGLLLAEVMGPVFDDFRSDPRFAAIVGQRGVHSVRLNTIP